MQQEVFIFTRTKRAIEDCVDGIGGAKLSSADALGFGSNEDVVRAQRSTESVFLSACV